MRIYTTAIENMRVDDRMIWIGKAKDKRFYGRVEDIDIPSNTVIIELDGGIHMVNVDAEDIKIVK